MKSQKSEVDAVISGGGLSGLSAAVELASKGAKVVLFEQAPKLGGRCYSYLDEKTGDVVDNGQHVLLGAYHNTLRYLDLIGTRSLLRVQPKLSLPFHHPEKGFASFEISSLPKPFHLTTGMLKFKLLSLRERQKLLNVGFELSCWNHKLEEKLSSLTIEQWLTGLGQSEEAKKNFWYPIAISVMNELPECASALLFARSLKAAFLGKKSDASVLIPTVGQTELYVNGAVEFLQKHNASIHTRSEVEAVEVEKSKVTGIRLKNGKVIKSKHVVGAVPHTALKKLIPAGFRNEPPFVHFSKFASSPIVSLHLWFDKDFMEMEFVGLIDHKLQWVFNRRKIMGEEKKLSYISAVISGAYDVVDLTKEELVTLALKDLSEVFPESVKAKLVHSIVIKEKRATFSPTNEVEPFRPSSETPIKNFYLAGDWTNTGLPATIEGAVMSGFRTASLV